MRDLLRRAMVVAGSAAVLVVPSVAVVAGGATVAQAAPGACTAMAGTVTCTYNGAGTYTFTVPAGVSSLDVTAAGAVGGPSAFCGGAGSGGPGASVEDTAVPVSAFAGQDLTVVVGGAGQPGAGNNGGAGGTPGGGGAGGDYPGGNASANCDGGGGGGFSGLLDPSGNPLVIAAGGGGGSPAAPEGTGGAGDIGNGSGGGPGQGICAGADGCGGGGGTSTMGGTGGAGAEVSGPLVGGTGINGASLDGGQGGASNATSTFSTSSGGGGGGGYYGGGGGGGGENSGAGGGGSSFGTGPGLTNGQTNTAAASVTFSYPVISTSLALGSSGTPSAFGAPVTYTATVTPAPDGGTVNFTSTDSLGCTGVPVDPSTGQATCVITYSIAGPETVVADYSGDVSYEGSVSNFFTQVVDQATPGLTVAPAASPATTGGTASATAALTGGSPAPTGTVDYRYYASLGACQADVSGFPGTAPSGGTDVGAVTLTGTGSVPGSAPVAAGSPGTYWWAGFYSGDSSNAAAASGCAAQQVGYGLKLQYNPAKANRSGSAVPVKVQLVNAAGTNMSAAGIKLTVTGLSPSPAPGKVPAGSFKFTTSAQGPGYQFNVKTTGYPAGTYSLTFTATGDPATHTVTFVVS